MIADPKKMQNLIELSSSQISLNQNHVNVNIMLMSTLTQTRQQVGTAF